MLSSIYNSLDFFPHKHVFVVVVFTRDGGMPKRHFILLYPVKSADSLIFFYSLQRDREKGLA